MIDDVLQIVAPHYCYGCGIVGSTLCSNCKYDIISDGFSACIVCGMVASDGICSGCRTSYEKAWCVGDRTDTLERIINAFKFERAKQAHQPLADLLDGCLPVLPASTVIVPVPTISAHIRQRGYDHTLLIAKRLAKKRQLSLINPLHRTSKSMQRGASRSVRFKQAKKAFICTRQLNPEALYLLIDDVVTTNATLQYSAQALRDAGAENVWVAVIARQPLDKKA